MGASKLNDWLGVITNVGLIIGLVLVAYEVRQTHVAMDQEYRGQIAELYATATESWQNFGTRLIDSAEVADWS